MSNKKAKVATRTGGGFRQRYGQNEWSYYFLSFSSSSALSCSSS